MFPAGLLADNTWDGGGASGSWSDLTNWGSNTTPVSSTLLTFGGTLQLNSNNDLFAADTSFAGITFNTGAGAFVLTGSRITLTGNVTNNDDSLQTLNLDMIMGATRTFTVASGDLAVGGILSGSGGFTLAQSTSTARTLTLTGANTYSGTTTVGSGTLIVSGAAGTINASTSISIGINTGNGPTAALLRLDNTLGNVDRIGDARPITLFNRGELALIGNTTTSTSETLGALTFGTTAGGSSGTITLSGTAGGLLTTLTAASFTRVGNSTGLIRGTSLGQQSTNATRFTLTNTSGLSFVGTTTANGATPGSAKDVRIVPYLLGDTSATGNGSSFVTYDTTGGLRPLAATEYTTLSAGYTAPVNAENVRAFNGTLTTANPTVNSLLFSTASQTLNGSGTLTVESGAIAAVVDTVAIGSGFSGITLGNGIWNEGVLTATGSNVFTISAPINVTGGAAGVLTKGGTGFVHLAGNSSYDATTYVTNGSLRVLHNNALGSTTGNTVVHGDAGGRLYIGNSGNQLTVAEPLSLIGQNPSFAPTLLVDGGQQRLTGAITATGQQRWSITNGSLTVTGGVTGANIFFVDNASANGALIFTTTPLNLGSGGTYYHDSGGGLAVIGVAGNTWGTTTVANTGSVRLDVANALPSTSLLRIGLSYATTGLLDLNGNSQTVNGLENGTATAGIRIVRSANAATLTLSSSNDRSFDGTFQGALGLIKNGSNIQTLSGASTHTGDTRVNVGTLALGNLNALQASTLDTGTSGTQAVTFTVAGTYNLGGLKGADDLAIAANSLSVGANNQSTSFTGAITGTTGGLTKLGTGSLTLGGTNTFTGATSVNSGTLVLDYTASDTSKLSDTAVTGVLTLGSATLQIDRSASASGTHTEAVLSTTLNGAASITRGTGSTATLQMNAITRNPGASVNFGAASIASTDTTNTNGILGAWATIGGTDFAINSTNAADGPITAYTAYTDVTRLSSGTKAIADGSTTNVRIIEGTGSLANITLGAATTTINTLNQSSTGGTATLDAAGQTLRVAGILAGSGSSALTIGTAANDGTLTAATSGGELILQNYSGNTLTINSVIANNTTASGLTQSGTGTTVLAGTNTYTGKTVINGGKLSIAAETGLGSNPAGATPDQLTLNGGTLLSTATFSIDDTNRGITLGAAGGTFEVSAGTLTVASTNVITGTGGLTKTGTGQLTLSAVNTYTGPTTLSGGILSVGTIGNGGVAGNLGAANAANSNLIFDGGTLQYTGATAITDRFFTINDAKTATIEITNIANSLTLGGGAPATSGALNKTGAGTLILTGGSDYTGSTTVSVGALTISANNALGSSASGTSVLNNAALHLQGYIKVTGETLSLASGGLLGSSGALRNLSGTNEWTGNITIDAASSRIASDLGILKLSGNITQNFTMLWQGDGNIEASGIISGNFGVTRSNIGAGTLTLSGPNTFNGSADINNGVVSINSINNVGSGQGASALGTASSAANGRVNLGSSTGAFNGTLIYTGAAAATDRQVFLNSQSGNGTLDQSGTGLLKFTSALGTANSNASTTRTLVLQGSTAGSGEFEGVVANQDTATGRLTAVTKQGTGTWTLSGANTYTGATVLNAGTLAVSGSISGTTNVAVNTGGTLLLSGAGGANNKLNTSATATFGGGKLDLGGITSSSLDQQVGALTLSISSVLDFGTLAAGNTFRFADSTSVAWTSGQTLSIWNWTAGVDHLYFGSTFGGGVTAGQLGQISFYSGANGTGFVGLAAYDVGGELSAIPEPSTTGLLGVAGLAGLIGFREFRRRRPRASLSA